MKTSPSKADLNHSRLCVDQVVADVTNEIMSKVKPDDFDTAIVKKINAMCVKCFEQFSKMHQLNVTPMTKADAIEHIRKMYKDELATWSKDELLESFALVQATLGAEAFSDQLI